MIKNLGLWLKNLLPKITREILIALGFGFVTFTGLEVVYQHLMNLIPQYFNGIPQDILMLMNIAGFGEGLNILLGAVSSRFSYFMLTKMSKAVIKRPADWGVT